MTTRRDFLTTIGAGVTGAALWPAAGSAAASIRFACHTMTWGDDYETGIAEIGKAGFHGVQLRANVQTRYGERPADLKALLARHKVEFVCFSSGNVALGAGQEAETFADRKSTRLNSSHLVISYAVFCSKK